MYQTWKETCYQHLEGDEKNIVNTTGADGTSCSQIEGKLSESKYHKKKLCSHCKLKSGYFLSGNQYKDDSRNISGKGDNKYICDKCELPNDYLLQPITKINLLESFKEIGLHILSITLILLYSFIFTNLSFKIERFSNEEKKK